MDAMARRRVAASALCHGIEGFGLGRRIHTGRFPDVSTDLPLVACAVDSRQRIERCSTTSTAWWRTGS